METVLLAADEGVAGVARDREFGLMSHGTGESMGGARAEGQILDASILRLVRNDGTKIYTVRLDAGFRRDGRVSGKIRGPRRPCFLGRKRRRKRMRLRSFGMRFRLAAMSHHESARKRARPWRRLKCVSP